MIIKIQYCDPKNSYKVKSIEIKSGTTIAVLLRDIIKTEYKTTVGVYGKIKDDAYIIQNNDRIEIYEKIIADPKINRKKRALNDKC